MTKYKSVKNLAGFTLLELIVVMSVLAILASLVMVTYPSAQERARDTQRISDLRQYQTLLEVYANNNDGNYPSSGTNLANMCSSGTLQSNLCPTPPQALGNYVYSYNSGSYYIYVELEQKSDAGNTVYQFFCSNGNSGQTETQPTTNPC